MHYGNTGRFRTAKTMTGTGSFFQESDVILKTFIHLINSNMQRNCLLEYEFFGYRLDNFLNPSLGSFSTKQINFVSRFISFSTV